MLKALPEEAGAAEETVEITHNRGKGGRLLIKIGEWAIQDLEAVTKLMAHLGYPTSTENMVARMERIRSDPMYRTWVAEYRQQVVGLIGLRKVILYETDHPAVQVAALVTRPEYRGRGIGKALLRRAEAWSKEQGASLIYLTSGNRPEREAAHRFYRHMGYEISGYRFSKVLK